MSQGAGVIRKRVCADCGTQETPQWRQGPNGPQTLCNACGVRYSRMLRCQGGAKRKTRPGAAAAATGVATGVAAGLGRRVSPVVSPGVEPQVASDSDSQERAAGTSVLFMGASPQAAKQLSNSRTFVPPGKALTRSRPNTSPDMFQPRLHPTHGPREGERSAVRRCLSTSPEGGVAGCGTPGCEQGDDGQQGCGSPPSLFSDPWREGEGGRWPPVLLGLARGGTAWGNGEGRSDRGTGWGCAAEAGRGERRPLRHQATPCEAEGASPRSSPASDLPLFHAPSLHRMLLDTGAPQPPKLSVDQQHARAFPKLERQSLSDDLPRSSAALLPSTTSLPLAVSSGPPALSLASSLPSPLKLLESLPAPRLYPSSRGQGPLSPPPLPLTHCLQVPPLDMGHGLGLDSNMGQGLGLDSSMSQGLGLDSSTNQGLGLHLDQGISTGAGPDTRRMEMCGIKWQSKSLDPGLKAENPPGSGRAGAGASVGQGLGFSLGPGFVAQGFASDPLEPFLSALTQRLVTQGGGASGPPAMACASGKPPGPCPDLPPPLDLFALKTGSERPSALPSSPPSSPLFPPGCPLLPHVKPVPPLFLPSDPCHLSTPLTGASPRKGRAPKRAHLT